MYKSTPLNTKILVVIIAFIFLNQTSRAQNFTINKVLVAYEEKQLDVLYPVPVSVNKLTLSASGSDGNVYEVTEFEVLLSRGGAPIQIETIEGAVLDLKPFELVTGDAFSIRVTALKGVDNINQAGAVSLFFKDLQDFHYANPYEARVLYVGKDLGNNAKIPVYYKQLSIVLVSNSEQFYEVNEFEVVQIRKGASIESRSITGPLLNLTGFQTEVDDAFSIKVTEAKGIDNQGVAIGFAVITLINE